MRKLDKQDCARRDEIFVQLQAQLTDLEASIEVYNAKIGAAWTVLEEALGVFNSALDEAWGNELEPAVNAYNEVVADANSWKQDIASEIQEYMDERSEKWQESEAASRYTSWKEAYEEEFQEVSLERPDDFELEEPALMTLDDVENHVDLMQELPDELAGQE